MDTFGAAQVHMADKEYELEIFENLYLKFLFWEGDDCINTFNEIAKRL